MRRTWNTKRIALIVAAAVAVVLLAWVVTRQVWRGDLKEQLAQFQDRAARYPEDPENYKRLSEFWNQLGNRAESDRFYDLYQRAKRAEENKDDVKRRQELAGLREALARGPSPAAPALSDDRESSRSKSKMESVENAADAAMKKAVAAYNEGLKYYDAGDNARAQRKFEEAVAAKPDYSKAWSKLSRLAMDRGDLRGASDAARRALDSDPKNDEAWLTSGDVARETKDFVKADEGYRKAVESNPQNDMAFYRLAGLRFRDRRYGEASDLYSKSWSINDRFYKCALNWGLTRSRLGDPAGARQKFEAALRIPAIQNDPASLGLAYSQLGAAYEALGDKKTALAQYQKAVAAQKNPGDYFSMGRLYESLGDNAKAREQYLQVTREKPDHREAWYNLGMVYFNERHWGEAFKNYQQALAVDPRFLQAQVQAGKCQAELGNADGAKGFFEAAVRLEAGHPTANLELARYWKNKGIFDKAVPYGQTAAAASAVDERVNGLNELGLIYLKMKLYDDALKYLQQARGLHPSNAEVLANLAKVHTELGRFDEAATVTEALLKVNRADWESYERLGNLYVKIGKKDEAKEILGKLLSGNPSYPNKAKVQELLRSL
ncbi:MAG: tetratricopeptide repeat protein [Spirochaetes bacterium]|nr:tetratricopeptide repeat protein [Spirochaetota bacterium]